MSSLGTFTRTLTHNMLILTTNPPSHSTDRRIKSTFISDMMDDFKHRTSMIRSTSLSTILSSVLTNPSGEVGVKMNASSKKLNKPSSEGISGSRDNSQNDLMKEFYSRSHIEDFRSRIPAEPPTEGYLISQNSYPAIRALRTDEDLGDGLWMCCYCRHENIP